MKKATYHGPVPGGTYVAKRRGRPQVAIDQFKIARSIRLTPEQWLKLDQLGGVAWIRERIDKARP
jgi:hypothetical protein